MKGALTMAANPKLRRSSVCVCFYVIHVQWFRAGVGGRGGAVPREGVHLLKNKKGPPLTLMYGDNFGIVKDWKLWKL